MKQTNKDDIGHIFKNIAQRRGLSVDGSFKVRQSDLDEIWKIIENDKEESNEQAE
uniref:Uncharacterized protein n=1 Tax=viral metagenome TaxID=1070528 RepID=A0A6M3LLH3_9ZZZZ